MYPLHWVLILDIVNFSDIFSRKRYPPIFDYAEYLATSKNIPSSHLCPIIICKTKDNKKPKQLENSQLLKKNLTCESNFWIDFRTMLIIMEIIWLQNNFLMMIKVPLIRVNCQGCLYSLVSLWFRSSGAILLLCSSATILAMWFSVRLLMFYAALVSELPSPFPPSLPWVLVVRAVYDLASF